MYHIIWRSRRNIFTRDTWEEEWRSSKPRDPPASGMHYYYRVINADSGAVIYSNLPVDLEAEVVLRSWPLLADYRATGKDPRLRDQLQAAKNNLSWAAKQAVRYAELAAQNERAVVRLRARVAKLQALLDA